MNDIVKNTELFVNILSMSRTSAVQKWDHEAFQRAFRWAHYFEQVHKKTKSKQHVAKKISQHLSDACSQVDAKLGLSPLMFSDLPNSTSILRKNLLENSYITNDFYLQLVEQFNAQAGGEETLKSQLHSLSKLKATLQILQLIQKRFELLSSDDSENEKSEKAEEALLKEIPKEKQTEKKKKEDKEKEKEREKEKAKEKEKEKEDAAAKMNKSSAVKSQITANAVLLRKCLLNVINQAPSLCSEKKSQLHTKLANMVKHERGVDVLLLALICDEKDDQVSKYIINFIKDMLVPKWKENWKLFLQLPLSKLFGQSSALYKDFSIIYFELLQHCGDNLQKEVERNKYVLLMEKTDCGADEQMCKYYYYLLQNLLITLAQPTPENELQVEAFIRSMCTDIPRNLPVDTNVWIKLSHDMMISLSPATSLSDIQCDDDYQYRRYNTM